MKSRTLNDLICPATKFYAIGRFYAVTDRYDDVKAVKSNRLFDSINTQKMRVVIPFDFLQKRIVNMLSKRFFVSIEQTCHLVCCEPHSLVLYPHLQPDFSLRLIKYDFAPIARIAIY